MQCAEKQLSEQKRHSKNLESQLADLLKENRELKQVRQMEESRPHAHAHDVHARAPSAATITPPPNVHVFCRW